MRYQFSPGRFVFLVAFSLITACGPAIAAAPPRPATARERTLAAHEFTVARLAVWQKRLDLEDWNISIIISRASELRPRTLGNIHWDKDSRTAVIRVLDPADYRLPYDDMLKDMEFTVVHELIHLELASLPRSEASRGAEEHAVNGIADALLRLDRGTK
jgi:hypothetical protein